MFDYKLIEAFGVVIQEGGFEKAAVKLFLTQSAVSQRVKQLEEQFGQIVLLRTSPPQPTSFGRTLLGLYNQVVRLENDLLKGHSSEAGEEYTSLPIGINADTLATWFFEAIRPLLREQRVVLDLMVDDQDQTHRFLKDGKVLGCVTTRGTPIQGCVSHFLGDVEYGLFCTENFRKHWFAEGLSLESVSRAPMITFNRKDLLNIHILEKVLCSELKHFSTHYVPSAELFLDVIENGLAYGAMPYQQCYDSLTEGRIVELVPKYREQVSLFWQCWNIDSALLKDFTRRVVAGFTATNSSPT